MSESILKHHKLISLCIGLGFLLSVQKFAVPEPIFRFLIPTFFLYILIAAAYNSWYLKQDPKI